MLGLPCGPVAKTSCFQYRGNGFDPQSGNYPCGSAGKESTCNTGDLGSTPGLGRSPGEGNGYPLQYSGLENSKGVAKSWTRPSDFHAHVLGTKVSYAALCSQPKPKKKKKKGIMYFCLLNLEPCICKERLHISLKVTKLIKCGDWLWKYVWQTLQGHVLSGPWGCLKQV